MDGNGSGWDAYSRYSKGDMPLLKQVGGTVVWAGHVLESYALHGDELRDNWDRARTRRPLQKIEPLE